MIVDKIDPEEKIGRLFKIIMTEAVPRALEGDDDYFILCVGGTGTGKSSLMLHGYEIFDPEGCDVSFIGFDPKNFAAAIKAANNKPGKRFCCNDEANLSKRRAMSKFNNDVLDMYYAIRGLRIFHWWNNPSADILDKPFLERIKGVIYILPPGKNVNAPRSYYYFHAKDLKRLLEKEGNLSLKTLSKNAKKFAYFKSWFRKYDGKLWDAYLEKKSGRMSDKVAEFFGNYGEEGEEITAKHVKEMLGIKDRTYKRYVKYMLENNILVEGIHYNLNNMDWKIYTPEALEKFKEVRQVMNDNLKSKLSNKGDVVPGTGL